MGKYVKYLIKREKSKDEIFENPTKLPFYNSYSSFLTTFYPKAQNGIDGQMIIFCA